MTEPTDFQFIVFKLALLYEINRNEIIGKGQNLAETGDINRERLHAGPYWKSIGVIYLPQLQI